MWFAILGEDIDNSLEKRLSVRPAHLARLEALQNAGRLLLAGPFPALETENPGPAGFTGSLIVAEFESLASAQSWAEQDPYVAAGVYSHVTVRPFRPVFPQ